MIHLYLKIVYCPLQKSWANLTNNTENEEADTDNTYCMIPLIERSKTDQSNLWCEKSEWQLPLMKASNSLVELKDLLGVESIVISSSGR